MVISAANVLPKRKASNPLGQNSAGIFATSVANLLDAGRESPQFCLVTEWNPLAFTRRKLAWLLL